MKYTVFAISILSIISLVGFLEAREVSPFVFELSPDADNYFTSESIDNGGPPEIILEQSSVTSFPLIIRSTTEAAIPVKFHATFGDQISHKLPPGITISIEPDSFILKENENVTLNVQVEAANVASDGWYFINLVGTWNENDFSGTNIILKIGDGSDTILTPSDFIKSPLQQIKNGISLIDVKCTDGKYPSYKYDRMSVACVSEETQIKLINRGWATMRLINPGENVAQALCNNYQGKWHPEHEGCRNITDLQCSLLGGKFVNNLRICSDGICPDKGYPLCVVNPDAINTKKQ